MRRTLTALLLVLNVGVLLAPATLAQNKKEKHKELGVLNVERPRTYNPVPTTPGERWVKLYWREPAPAKDDKRARRRAYLPELRLVIIPKAQKKAEASDEQKREGRSRVERKGVHDLKSWLKTLRGKWTPKHVGEGRRLRGYQTDEYEISVPDAPTLRAWAYVAQDDSRSVILFGVCHQDDWDEESKTWRKGAHKLKLAEPEANEYEGRKWERYYKQKRLSHPEYRIRVREQLVEPWKAEDTDNYIFVYNTSDEPLLRRIMKDIEAMRLEYIERFPPVGEFTAVSTVRICKDFDEYLAYGGSPRSAGYWNYVEEELVLYDAAKQEKNKRPDDSDTFVVLYHEAFHQYIFYSTGELSPHSWFNEGYGDFFSGADIQGTKVRKIGVNPWRAAWIQRQCAEGTAGKNWVPWEKMVRYSQRQYYQNGGPNYAQGWSMIYFLSTAPAVQRDATWREILPTYFQVLKEAYAEELAKLGENVPPLRREPAKQKARERAVEAAFAGVDFDELEEAWREYIAGISVPERD